MNIRFYAATTFIVLSLSNFALFGAFETHLESYHFDEKGTTRPVLDNSLKRSVTMSEFLKVDPFGIDVPYSYKNDDVRLIKNIGKEFIGREFYGWGSEDVLNNPDSFEQAKRLVGEVRASDRDVIFQAALIGMADPGLFHWKSFIGKLRRYAKNVTRRGWVLLDAHVPTGGMVVDGASLLDFNSFPMRIKEIPEKPQQAILETGYLDALFNRSKGSTTPSGWHCQSLPYLVEFDNFNCSHTPGKSTIESHFIWGYDEITWFYLQSETFRQQWLKYAYNWVRENDPNGFLQMPVSRVVSLCEGKGKGNTGKTPNRTITRMA